MAADNKSLARFILDGILPAPRGVPQVEVEFNIDANGVVAVAARDKATNKEQHITIQPSSGLSKDEVERLRHEAEMHASEDAARRETVEIRNAADTLAYSAEKTLRDNADKVSPELKERVEASVKAVRDALGSDDANRIREAMEELSQRMQEIGQAVYGAGQNGAGGAPDGDGEGRKEEAGTVEGEFREV
jgi:molecular chaperone DnaK